MAPLLRTLQRSLPSFSLPGSSPSSAASSPAPSPLPPHTLAALAARRAALVRLVAAVAEHLRVEGKLRVDPSRSLGGSSDKHLAAAWLAREFEGYADAVTADDDALDGYGPFLASVGTAHVRLADLVLSHVSALSTTLLPPLESLLAQHDALQKALRDAERLAATAAKLARKDDGDAAAGRERDAAESAWEDAVEGVERLWEDLRAAEGRERDAIEAYVTAEIEFTQARLALLLPLSPSSSSTSATRSTLQPPPPSTTRMLRSHSSPPLPPRTRSSSLKSTILPSPRARSGSLLSRLAGSSRPNSRTGTPPPRSSATTSTSDEEELDLHDGDDEDFYTSPRDPSSTTTTTSSSSSFPTLRSLNLSPPSLSSLSLKKSFSGAATSSPKYNALSDPPTSSTRDRMVISDGDVFAPSPTRTRSATTPSSWSGVSSSSPGAGKTTTAEDDQYPVGRTFVAQWAFSPSASASAAADDELPLALGARVRVDRVVNPEWWVGTLLSPPPDPLTAPAEGMFPSAYVVEERKRAPPPVPRSRGSSFVNARRAEEEDEEGSPFAD